MLVLTRNADDEIIITDLEKPESQLTIKVLSKGKVKLGIDAPAHIRIDRMEIHKARQEGKAKPCDGEWLTQLSHANQPSAWSHAFKE